MFLLEIFIFVSVNSQNVTAEQSNITVVRGENATLKWLLERGSLHGFNKVEAYRGDSPNENSSLFHHKELSPFAAINFKNRLFDNLSPNSDIYELTVTDVQYRDNGSFNIKASFVGKSNNLVVYKNVTIDLIVRGSYLIF